MKTRSGGYLSVALLLCGCLGVAASGTFPGPAFNSVRDYGYLWWQNGLSTPIYSIKTSRYAFSFDTASFTPVAFFPLEHAPVESAVLGEPELAGFPTAPAVRFSCRFVSNAATNAVVPASVVQTNVQLVECGKFFQRRWQPVILRDGPGLNFPLSGLETAAWPDRISFVLRLVPTQAMAKATLEMTLGLTNAYCQRLTFWNGSALQAANGSGFVFLKSAGSSTLDVDATNALITVQHANHQLEPWAGTFGRTYCLSQRAECGDGFDQHGR